jgi:hypothetical protein
VPRLARLDWVVVLDTVGILALGIGHGGAPPSASFVRTCLFICGISCLILIVWMRRGGDKSVLWEWFPPFWPWGRYVRSSEGRWLVVLAMVGGAVIGGTLQWLRS